MINKRATSDRPPLTSWQLGFQWHRRGIELVFKSLDCFIKRLFHTATIFCCNICICCLKLHQADHKVEEFFFFFFTSIWWGSTQLQCINYLRHILISRPPRVFRHFKRHSCYTMWQFFRSWIMNCSLNYMIYHLPSALNGPPDYHHDQDTTIQPKITVILCTKFNAANFSWYCILMFCNVVIFFIMWQ